MEENANKLHLVTSNFVTRARILIFSVLENGVSFPILIEHKIFHVTVLLVIYFCGQFCGTGNSSQQTSLHCLSTINMVFSDEDKIIKKFVFDDVHSEDAFTDAFPEKRWTKHGVNKLLQTLLDTGTVYRQPEI